MISRVLKRYSRRKIFLFLGDLILLSIGTLITISIKSDGASFELVNPLENMYKFIQYFIVVLFTLYSFRYLNLYKQRIFFTTIDQFGRITRAILSSSIVLIFFTFFMKSNLLDLNYRLHVILFCFINLTIILIFRFSVHFYLSIGTGRRKFFRRRIIAIGAGEVGIRFNDFLCGRPDMFMELVGFVDDDLSKLGVSINGIKVIGTTYELLDIVDEYKIDEIFITIESIGYNKLLDLIQVVKKTDCQVNLISSHYDIIEKKVDTIEFEDFRSVPIFTKISPLYSEYLKPVFDRTIASIILFIISPIMLLIWLIIKFDSRGPAIFKADVIGKRGRAFTWYKFRSMRYNSQHISHEKHLKEIIKKNQSVEKIKNDPRITKIGKFLRKYSLDELPQLINVIKGDMSLVGPRPCLPYEYELMNDWHKKRFNIFPGLTGLWQISGRDQSDVNFNDSLILDLYYSDNISAWFDLKILLKTIPVVIFGKGGR
jgi:undecaprenyl-phosphate galactose phosphotransferase